MHSIPLFLAIVIAFGLSFLKHISLAMYPLSAFIFYFYLPVLYSSSRINILHHIKNKEMFHIKYYPMELSVWFVSTCFFAFILSHLASDLLFHHRQEVYHFLFFLISAGLIGILYCERDVSRFHISSKKTLFEIQGRLLSFQIFFIMTIFFVMSH